VYINHEPGFYRNLQLADLIEQIANLVHSIFCRAKVDFDTYIILYIYIYYTCAATFGSENDESDLGSEWWYKVEVCKTCSPDQVASSVM